MQIEETFKQKALVFKRITSIDALRAFALFGILLVHVRHGFCADVVGSMHTSLDNLIGGGF